MVFDGRQLPSKIGTEENREKYLLEREIDIQNSCYDYEHNFVTFYIKDLEKKARSKLKSYSRKAKKI
jgi:hypothetical protein